MSDTEKEEAPIIVTAKDPKKVELGKRLAAISKEAKEKKMRARIREEDFTYMPWIGYGIACVSSFGFLYMLLKGKKEEPELEKVEYEPEIKMTKKKKFEGF